MEIKHNGPILDIRFVKEKKPSWKRYGRGVGELRITSHEANPWLDITVTETAFADPMLEEKRDVTKTAMITLDAGNARVLFEALREHFDKAIA